jgi:hypothetical protein
MPKKKTRAESAREERIFHIRDLLPIYSIESDHTVLKPSKEHPLGQVVVYLKVQPHDFGLMATSERNRLIRGYTKAYNGITSSFQLISLTRNVDLSSHVNELKNIMQYEENSQKLKVLSALREDATIRAARGTSTEREYYFLFTADIDKDGTDRPLKILREQRRLVKEMLLQAGVSTTELEYDQIRGVLQRFATPSESDQITNHDDPNLFSHYRDFGGEDR